MSNENEAMLNSNTPIEKPVVRRWGIWLMIPLTVGTLVLCVLSWQWRDSLKFERFFFEGSKALSAQQLYALTNVPARSPMYAIDLYAVRKRLLAQPFIKTARINRQYPNALRVRIEERQPLASLNCGDIRYVDAAGVILPSLQSPARLDLPVISGISGLQNVKLGQELENSELSEAIEVLQCAQSIDSSLYHFLSEVNMNSGKDIILYSTDVGVPILLGRGDVGKKLVMLQSFWGNFIKADNASKLQYVDLRYDEQVVVKWLSDAKQAQHSMKASL